MKHTTEYLYDCSPEEFADLPYREALEYKITKANELIHRLMYDYHYSTRDDIRVNKVFDAIKHNTQLLKELH